MKLHELNTDRALDALCELTPYISNIAADESMVSAVGKIVNVNKDMNMFGQGLVFMERMGEIIPMLLRKHRADVYGILSVLNDKPASDIASQPAGDTIRQIRDVFQDEDLLSFFRSSVRRVQSEPSVPSAESPASA